MYQTGNGWVRKILLFTCYFHVHQENQTLQFFMLVYWTHVPFALNLIRRDECSHNCRVDLSSSRTLKGMKTKLRHCLKASVSYSASRKTVVLISKSHFQIIENFPSTSHSTVVFNFISKCKTHFYHFGEFEIENYRCFLYHKVGLSSIWRKNTNYCISKICFIELPLLWVQSNPEILMEGEINMFQFLNVMQLYVLVEYLLKCFPPSPLGVNREREMCSSGLLWRQKLMVLH